MNLAIHEKKEQIKKLITELNEIARMDSDNVKINIDIEHVDETYKFGQTKNALGLIDISVVIEY